MSTTKYFIEYTVRIGSDTKSVGDFTNEVQSPEYYTEECGLILSKMRGQRESVEFLYQDQFDDDCFLMYTYESANSDSAVYVQFYHYKKS